MISLKDYITASGKHPEFLQTWDQITAPQFLNANASMLLSKVSELISRAEIESINITSGWRPSGYNKAIGGAPNSKHVFAQAIDIWDPDKKIGQWCQNNIETLSELGLYMESLMTTHKSDDPNKRWVHLQTVAPESGNIIFIP